MTPVFPIRTVPHFDRLLRRLERQHADLADRYAEALDVLRSDPYNRIKRYAIKKLREAGAR